MNRDANPDTATFAGLYGVLVSFPRQTRRERAADAAHAARLEANRQASRAARGLAPHEDAMDELARLMGEVQS